MTHRILMSAWDKRHPPPHLGLSPQGGRGRTSPTVTNCVSVNHTVNHGHLSRRKQSALAFEAVLRPVRAAGRTFQRQAVTLLLRLPLLALACCWPGRPAFTAVESPAIRRVPGLEVRALGKRFQPDPQRTLARQKAFDHSGNTSARNTDAAHLDWKTSGYFQRNRDLGQVFTAERDCRLEAIVLRTGPGTGAVLAGAPGAKVFVQFFEVTGTPRIHDNGTPPGAAALHGFSKNHRCDDYLVGVEYRPLVVATGGVFPELPPTRDWEGKTNGSSDGCLVYLRWTLKDEARLPLKAGQRYAFMVGFEEPGRERGFTLANANAAGVNAPPSLTDAHDRYHGGWALRREGDGTTPPTMRPAPEPPRDPVQFARLRAEALFAQGPSRFALSPTTDGFPDVDTYRDLEFYLEIEPVPQTRWLPDHQPRLFVLTDISNEPDDEESMVRLLVYANEFDIEGLVATTSTWLRNTTRVDLIHRQLDAYSQARSNLLKHAPGFPSAEALRAVTAVGQPAYGLAAVGEGKSTPGSRLLIAAADKADARPLWVPVWGGANTLAQALFDARRERSPEALQTLVGKLRVYAISDQDDSGPWLRREFPGLFYIVSPSGSDWKEYWRATWTGISGDRHYKNGPGHKFHLVDNPWLETNIIKNHGPLGALYPRLEYIMEGDTPSFLGLINNGLGWHLSPAYGGWGGRYALYQPYGETRSIWSNNQDSRDAFTADNGQTQCTDMATIWRWREHFQHDFAARMDWCVADDYRKANHNPVAVLNGDTTKRVIELTAKPGETVTLSAEGTDDPDGDAFEARWWIYPEASTLRDTRGHSFPPNVALSNANGLTTRLTVPAVKKPAAIHIILEAQDRGTPSLWAYRRAIIQVQP